MPDNSGLSENTVVGSLYWVSPDAYDPSSHYTAVFNAVKAFYHAWENNMSVDYTTALRTVKFYNMSHPLPRVPIYTNTYSFTGTASTTSGPHETAICISYQGAITSGDNARRRRGRLYCGPFNAATQAFNRPGSSMLTLLAGAAGTFKTSLAAIDSTNITWAVYSKADALAHSVVSGWVDDEYDTQRRRGLHATTRTTF